MTGVGGVRNFPTGFGMIVEPKADERVLAAAMSDEL